MCFDTCTPEGKLFFIAGALTRQRCCHALGGRVTAPLRVAPFQTAR